MKKTLLIFTVLGIACMIIFNIDFPLNDQSIYGKYLNKNFDNLTCCVEAPHVADTLILYRNGTFKSKFYSVGTYHIENGINPEIELHYKELDKPAIYKTYFSNKIFRKPRIILNADLNHYYEKLD
ncbi:hypothetical protein [Chryseobacterium sp. MYb328]|uniref:hypothetical protein n=1 Tax=Chryseobacterium sp. MYb328 TaxID=2745231 RepID=UPI00309C19CD